MHAKCEHNGSRPRFEGNEERESEQHDREYRREEYREPTAQEEKVAAERTARLGLVRNGQYLSGRWDTGARTSLEFGGGYSVVEEPIPETENQPDSNRYIAGDDSPLSSRVDGEDDVGSETKHWRSIWR